MSAPIQFTAQLWLYHGKGAWCFVTLPPDSAAQVKFFGVSSKAFGSVRVDAAVGKSRWRTSLFPDSKSGSYLLSFKAEISRTQSLAIGDNISVSLEVLN